jgi:hypothetical protein
MRSNRQKAITTAAVWLVFIALTVFGMSLIGLREAPAVFIICAGALTIWIWIKPSSRPMSDKPVGRAWWLKYLWIVPMTAAIVGAAVMIHLERQYNAEKARVIGIALSTAWVREKLDGSEELQCDTPTKNADGSWAVVVHRNSPPPREELRLNIFDYNVAP